MAFNGELYEIYSWLPVKPLYKLSTAAKPCIDFLSEPFFVMKQCQNSASKPEECVIIQDDLCSWHKPEVFDFCALYECSNSTDKTIVPSRSLNHLKHKGRVLTSSNGLLLCRTTDPTKPARLFLCNPATKTWLPFRLPNEDMAKRYAMNMEVNVVFICGEIFAEKKNKFPLDFTLLLFEVDTSEDWSGGYNVYSLKEGKWILVNKNLQLCSRDLDFKHYVYCNDQSLYLLSCLSACYTAKSKNYWPYVVHYNIHEHTSTILALPDEALEDFKYLPLPANSMRIFGWGKNKENGCNCFETICLVKSKSSKFWIWVLEIDKKDSKSSWRKIFDIDLKDDLGINDSMCSHKCFTGFMVTGMNLLFSTESHFYSYVLEGKYKGRLHQICENKYGQGNSLRFLPYSTTLRPCTKDGIKPPRIIG